MTDDSRRSLPLLLIVILAALGVMLIAAIVLVVNTNENTQAIKRNQAALVATQLKACRRANQAREQQISFYNAVIEGNQHRLEAWHYYLDNVVPLGSTVAPKVGHFARQIIMSTEEEIRLLQVAEVSFVATQRDVSSHPFSKKLRQRILINCTELYSR